MKTNIDIENAVLGAILLDQSSLISVQYLLKYELFSDEKNQMIYRAIDTLSKSGQKIDLLTITVELKKTNCLDYVTAYYVSSLTNRVASSANIVNHAAILNELFMLRELEKIGTLITQESNTHKADCFQIIELANKKIQELTAFVTSNTKHVGEIFNDVITEIKASLESNLPTGIQSGIKKLDEHTGGWQKGTLTILAARPGMGKTATALQFAKYPSISQGKPVAVFSLEMSSKSLVGRLMASESLISSSRINQKKVNAGELMSLGANCVKLADAPIYIDESTSLKISDLKMKAQKMKSEYKIELLIVDYLQLMRGDERGNREQEIGSITRGLKALSKDLDIPIIALSQLSRKVEERPDKRPLLSDLRESGSIEQDADIVMFLWRPEYYQLLDDYEFGNERLSAQNLMMIDIAKGREISLGEIPAKFYGEFMQITDYKTDYQKLNDNIDFLNK